MPRRMTTITGGIVLGFYTLVALATRQVWVSKIALRDLRAIAVANTADGETAAVAVVPLSVQSKQEDVTAHTTKKKESNNSDDDDLIKVAIYMTTHLSQLHEDFLRHCWPAATTRLPLLQKADLILYTSANVTNDDLLLRPLQFHNIVIKHYQEPSSEAAVMTIADPTNTKLLARRRMERQKQLGAIQAMTDPFLPTNRWFDAYDWVIRLNPDVLLRRDDWLLQTLQDDGVDAILIPYYYTKQQVAAANVSTHLQTTKMLHTDFYAFRPDALRNKEHLLLFRPSSHKKKPNAEKHLYNAFEEILHSGRSVSLPHVQRDGSDARILGRQSHVIHHHHLVDYCPDYYWNNATDGQFF